MKLLVCGGRDYHNAAAVEHALTTVHQKRGIVLLIEGGATGADEHARKWALRNGIWVQTYYADWDKHGRAAGPIRNRVMLEHGQPDGVVAFPGGRGTADMVRQAEATGLKVWQPYGKNNAVTE